MQKGRGVIVLFLLQTSVFGAPPAISLEALIKEAERMVTKAAGAVTSEDLPRLRERERLVTGFLEEHERALSPGERIQLSKYILFDTTYANGIVERAVHEQYLTERGSRSAVSSFLNVLKRFRGRDSETLHEKQLAEFSRLHPVRIKIITSTPESSTTVLDALKKLVVDSGLNRGNFSLSQQSHKARKWKLEDKKLKHYGDYEEPTDEEFLQRLKGQDYVLIVDPEGGVSKKCQGMGGHSAKIIRLEDESQESLKKALSEIKRGDVVGRCYSSLYGVASK